MLLVRARNGEWWDSNVGSWWVSISAESRGSAARRWRSAASISPSADKGLMIWGRTLADWKALRLRFLGVEAVAVVVVTAVEVTAVLVVAVAVGVGVGVVVMVAVTVVVMEEPEVGIGMGEGKEEELVICREFPSEISEVLGIEEEVVVVMGTRTTGVMAMEEVGLDESLRIFWGRIGILEGLEGLLETEALMEASVITGVGRGEDTEPELG